MKIGCLWIQRTLGILDRSHRLNFFKVEIAVLSCCWLKHATEHFWSWITPPETQTTAGTPRPPSSEVPNPIITHFCADSQSQPCCSVCKRIFQCYWEYFINKKSHNMKELFAPNLQNHVCNHGCCINICCCCINLNRGIFCLCFLNCPHPDWVLTSPMKGEISHLQEMCPCGLHSSAIFSPRNTGSAEHIPTETS